MLGLGIQLPWRQQALGIPRSGLVCWHDLYDPTESLASVPDLSGNGYSLQRGSTAGEDSNDPTVLGPGLSFATDDYCLTGNLTGVSMAGDWTVVLCGLFNGTKNGVWVFSAGDANERQRIYYQGDNNLRVGSTTDGTTVAYSASLAVPDTALVVAVVCRTDALTLRRLDTMAGVACANNKPDGAAKLILGAHSLAGQADAFTAYEHLFFNRALSNAELQRIYRSLKATWAARGVTIL